MKEIKYTILYVFVRTFVIPFYYGTGSGCATAKSYGSYSSGSAALISATGGTIFVPVTEKRRTLFWVRCEWLRQVCLAGSPGQQRGPHPGPHRYLLSRSGYCSA